MRICNDSPDGRPHPDGENGQNIRRGVYFSRRLRAPRAACCSVLEYQVTSRRRRRPGALGPGTAAAASSNSEMIFVRRPAGHAQLKKIRRSSRGKTHVFQPLCTTKLGQAPPRLRATRRVGRIPTRFFGIDSGLAKRDDFFECCSALLMQISRAALSLKSHFFDPR